MANSNINHDFFIYFFVARGFIFSENLFISLTSAMPFIATAALLAARRSAGALFPRRVRSW